MVAHSADLKASDEKQVQEWFDSAKEMKKFLSECKVVQADVAEASRHDAENSLQKQEVHRII